MDGAIHRAAGPDLVHACRLLHGCKTGFAKITDGFRLPARKIIHTVGPVWNGGNLNEPALLARCYRSSFEIARANGLRSIAFPAISCGIYGYPIPAATSIAVRETIDELQRDDFFTTVIFACFEAEVTEAYRAALPGYD